MTMPRTAGLRVVGGVVTALLLAAAALASAGQEPARSAQEPLYALVFRTGPAWDADRPPAEQPFFREHSQNLARLREQGSIVMGGRFSDVGLILVRAADEAAARALLAPDPSLEHGTMRVEIHRWRTIYPGEVPG